MFQSNGGDELAVEKRVVKKTVNEELGVDLLDFHEFCA